MARARLKPATGVTTSGPLSISPGRPPPCPSGPRGRIRQPHGEGPEECVLGSVGSGPGAGCCEGPLRMGFWGPEGAGRGAGGRDSGLRQGARRQARGCRKAERLLLEMLYFTTGVSLGPLTPFLFTPALAATPSHTQVPTEQPGGAASAGGGPSYPRGRPGCVCDLPAVTKLTLSTRGTHESLPRGRGCTPNSPEQRPFVPKHHTPTPRPGPPVHTIRHKWADLPMAGAGTGSTSGRASQPRLTWLQGPGSGRP